ncbi:MAG: hypothetical protein J5U17_01250 [Candidatus Methanoperedens sp.]|nr:hypothetical protein [Candidatus Methanoperedens sp.]MCE8427281.1 hypothetical protein [Candidatus Methanoperedens sp.]
MFDIFGKEEINSLKARISELEEEKRKLSIQLEKSEEKIRKTVSSRQVVDQELNEAKAKLSTFENEIWNLKKETRNELNFRFSESFSGNRLEDLIILLGSLQSRTSELITIYLAVDETLEKVPDDINVHIDTPMRYLIEKIGSPAGKIIFFDTSYIIRLVMIPVFPVTHSEYSFERRFNIEPLKASLGYDNILVLNAHAGETFIGIVETDAFSMHDIIRSSVMGKHSKGGWSQKRFQTLVEEDVKHHAAKVRDALGKMMIRYKDVKYVLASGDGKLIKMILEGYDYPVIMKSMDAQALNPQQILKEVMAVRCYGI